MPRRTDLDKILIIGSGPIVIGQACEFDYSGTQACKALREEGFTVVLVNSNPATIMTDPETADITYIEPITPESVARIIEAERPQAILPTLGGQTGLNCAMRLCDLGILDKYQVEMIGANRAAIAKAEGRDEFKKAMQKIGLEVAHSGLAYDMDEAWRVIEEIGFPAVIRPGFTLGGSGGGIAYNREEFENICRQGLDLSLNHEVLIEECLSGWKEFELEVMRDKNDNVVIICGIENFDPMGVHTGDSITVAPIQTLTDKEYQVMRDAAIRVIREIGVETGGSNIQFAVEPHSGRMVVIEMNPRVSRSSALASKATGFPIAKIAAKLAIGYTLDEIRNDITRETPACFEPVLDYCVVKFPRWTFEKFPTADPTLTTQMKSVGEVMAIGRTFKEAFQKALRSLETGRAGFANRPGTLPWKNATPPDREEIRGHLVTPRADRVDWIRTALYAGWSSIEIHEASRIDVWFLDQLAELVAYERVLSEEGRRGLRDFDASVLRQAKRLGFSDRQLAFVTGSDEMDVRQRRKELSLLPTYKLVDTCAAEFEAYTPYYYSTYEDEDETRIPDKPMVMILGGGPNRIGQGIEFDYCCCHAAFALRELDYASVMVNSNPETVSTDFDTSDLLFFEPLTHEDVLNIVDRLRPAGVIVQFGGQTPLNLATGLHRAGAPLIGTSVDSIDRAEDRDRFSQLLKQLDLRQPENGMATSAEQALAVAKRLGYPVLVRPSYVLGGRAMQLVYDDRSLARYMEEAVLVSPDRPILVDKFIEDALEVDVDAIADGDTVVVGGVMEHIEEAGIHSGDSCCSLPPYTLSDDLVQEICRQTKALAKELQVVGLMNIQFAVRGNQVYLIEVNPRASRTAPFVSKAIGVPLAKLAAKVMVGKKLIELGFTSEIVPEYFSVKAPVFPFNKFPGVDTVLGPEMKSTGEVMGIDQLFGPAFAKALLAADVRLPRQGRVFVSVRDADKRNIVSLCTRLSALGYELYVISGTYRALRNNGVPVQRINKVHEGRPHVIDRLKNGEIQLILNTPSGRLERSDDTQIRAQAVLYKIPCITNISGAAAVIQALEAMRRAEPTVLPIQEYHAQLVN